jgi:hypothetical protein
VRTEIKFTTGTISSAPSERNECLEIAVSEEINGQTYYYLMRSFCLDSKSSKDEIDAFIKEHEEKAAKAFARTKSISLQETAITKGVE